MGEPAGGILGRDGPEGGPDGGAVLVKRPRLGVAEEGLHLREGLLDRVQVGRAGRRPVRPLTPWRPAIATRHPEVAAGLVDPDEAGWVNATGLLVPAGALRRVALPGSDGLFFRVHPKCRVITRLIVA